MASVCEKPFLLYLPLPRVSRPGVFLQHEVSGFLRVPSLDSYPLETQVLSKGGSSS